MIEDLKKKHPEAVAHLSAYSAPFTYHTGHHLIYDAKNRIVITPPFGPVLADVLNQLVKDNTK